MTTEERLESLEQAVLTAKRRTRWLLAGVGCGVVALALVWTVTHTTTLAQGAGVEPRVFRGTDFILEDETGKLRAVLGVDKDGHGLTLLDETGMPRVKITLSKDGPALVLGDETGKPRASLRVYKDGPALVLLDKTGKAIWSAP